MKKIGIYKITFKGSDKIYIGSSINLNHRKRQHICELKKSTHHCFMLQRAFNKYGIELFNFEIIELCSEQNLLKKEQNYIDSIPRKLLMNSSIDASNCMRNQAIVDKWKLSLSDKERDRRRYLMINLRSRKDFKKNNDNGRNNFLNNGGRNILSEKCKTNKNRIIAVKESMSLRWNDEAFKSKIIYSIKNRLSIPVIGTKDGVDHEFISIIEASKIVGGYHQNISACISGKQKSHYGYTWRKKHE